MKGERKVGPSEGKKMAQKEEEVAERKSCLGEPLDWLSAKYRSAFVAAAKTIIFFLLWAQLNNIQSPLWSERESLLIRFPATSRRCSSATSKPGNKQGRHCHTHRLALALCLLLGNSSQEVAQSLLNCSGKSILFFFPSGKQNGPKGNKKRAASHWFLAS